LQQTQPKNKVNDLPVDRKGTRTSHAAAKLSRNEQNGVKRIKENAIIF